MLDSRPTKNLAERATKGITYSVFSNVGIKVLTAATQLILAWYLIPAEFGLAATAWSITAMSQILQTGGLHVILVRTKHRWVRLAGQAFYIGILCNTAICLAICLGSPWIAASYGEPRLAAVLCIVSLSFPLEQLALIESAWLVRRMRFERLAAINLTQALVRTIGQIALALAGFGVYALVIPMFPAIAIRVLATRAAARKIPLDRPRPSYWLPLWKETLTLNFNGFLDVLAQYGATFTISIALTTSATGLFFWANALAGQAIYLLGRSLNGVFLPVFANIEGDLSRQRQMFLKAATALTQLVAPLCLLQALVAHDVFFLFFADRWLPAWPVFAFISLSLIAEPLMVVTRSLLMAQGRYRRLVLVNAVAITPPLIAILAVMPMKNLSWIAAAYSVGVWLGALFALSLVWKPLQLGAETSVWAYFKPYALTLPATCLALLISCQLTSPATRIAVTSSCFSIVYLLTLRAWGGPAYELVAEQIKKVFNRVELNSTTR